MLELRNVYKAYDSPGQTESVKVINGVSLVIDKSRSVALAGESGCGKSTLLNIMGALDRPSSGQVLLDGRDLALLLDDDLAMVRNNDIGFIFQMHHLLMQCTVLENVLIPTLAKGGSSQADQKRALDLLDQVQMADFASYRPAQLSGGQCQRTAVARALINKPKIPLADEPTGSLDQDNAEIIGKLLMDIHTQENTALVVVTHSMNLAQQMDQIFEIKKGRLQVREK